VSGSTLSLGLYFLLSVWHLLLIWDYRAAAHLIGEVTTGISRNCQV
jgi:hypothetical protein